VGGEDAVVDQLRSEARAAAHTEATTTTTMDSADAERAEARSDRNPRRGAMEDEAVVVRRPLPRPAASHPARTRTRTRTRRAHAVETTQRASGAYDMTL
jgi:hypothetical protein